MRRKILETYGRFIARHAARILIGCVLLAALVGAVMPRLEFRTSRAALTSGEVPGEKLFDEYLAEFGPNSVVVVVEGGTELERQAFVDEMASRLAEQKGLVKDVLFRFEFFQKRFLGLLPLGLLTGLSTELEKEAPALEALSAARGLEGLHRLLIRRIEGETVKDWKVGEREELGLQTILDVVVAQKRLIERPAEAVESLSRLDLPALAGLFSSQDPRAAQLAHKGYITSDDGSVYVVTIQPVRTGDGPEDMREFLAAIRKAGDDARKARPEVTYSWTGLPVTIVEESDSVNRDAPLCSVMAAAGIGVLAAFAFRRKLAVLLVLLSLGFGILWNFGLTWAIFGGINLISSAVPVILIALGIDFGIHVVIAYEAERARGLSPTEAIALALERVGPGLTTGAITTSFAFYAICFMEYQGFKEFGAIAGNGVLMCLLAMASVLPALLVLTDRRPARPGKAPLAAVAGEPAGGPGGVPPPRSRLRRVWRAVCRGATAFPIPLTVAAAAITVGSLALSRGIGFDYRVEDLLPRDSESIRTQDKLKKYPDFSPEFAVVLCPDLASLRAADLRAQGQELIGRRDSILDVLPEGTPERREALMARIRKLLDRVPIDPSRVAPVDPAELRKSLEEISELFYRLLDKAVGTRLVPLLGEIARDLEDSADFLKAPPVGWATAFYEAEKRVWKWAGERKAEVEASLDAGPVREQDLPQGVLDHYRGHRTGRYALYLYPSVSLEERDVLRSFVEAAAKVDPRATGYPEVFYESTEMIHRGFDKAVIAAALVIFITLLVDFRRLGLVFLAILPKGLGIIWMLGLMRLLGINYNLANQIVVPLIIGVGLAYGIHIIHRFIREEPGERDITRVLEHTGGAIALSGLTTMIGFGSLALANHRGLASMGTVLFFGVGAAILASTFVLPAILCLVYRPKR